jgi:CubicO group peptidase (beta-lactamase class C family)
MGLICLSCLVAAEAVSPQKEDIASMKKALMQVQEDLITRGDCLSNGLQIVQRGKRIYHHTHDSSFPGDPALKDNTLFPIWSMTKPVTSVMAMILHEKGLFSLDDPVAEVIPALDELQVQGPGGALEALKRPITYRHLLLHTSGIYGYDGSFDEEGTWKEVMELEDLDALMRLLKTKPLKHHPGERYTYGLSTAVLGYAIEQHTGQSLATCFEQYIFAPLGMRETRFDLSPEDRKRFQPLFVKEGDLFRPGTQAEDELYYRSGSRLQLGGEGLVSTLRDYGLFCQMLVDRGRSPGGKVILSEATLDLMLQDQLGTVPGFGGPESEHVMGFGFSILKDPGKNASGTPKGIFGWGGYHTTYFWIDPSNELYVLFMTRRYPSGGWIEDALKKVVYAGFLGHSPSTPGL